jgi:hypothetical protein
MPVSVAAPRVSDDLADMMLLSVTWCAHILLCTPTSSVIDCGVALSDGTRAWLRDRIAQSTRISRFPECH